MKLVLTILSVAGWAWCLFVLVYLFIRAKRGRLERENE
jgi:hypothetical protein